MRKAVFLLIFLTMAFKVHALPLGNPADASILCESALEDLFCCGLSTDDLFPCNWVSLRFGYYGDFVYNRHVKLAGGDRFPIEDFELFTNAGYLDINFCDRVDIFGTLGATSIFIHTNAAGGGNGTRLDVEIDSSFSWSVGARATLFSYCCTALGGEFQYFYSKNDLTRFTIGAANSTYDDTQFLKYREWQFGLGITHQIACFFPYIGVKWSHVQVKLPDPSEDLRANKHWGYAVGTTLVACNAASLTAEGRWGDEKALHVNGKFRF